MSNYTEAVDLLASSEILDFDNSFELARTCSQLLADPNNENKGRDLAIRVLEKLSSISEDTHTMWNDIIESAGLYPYVRRDILSSSAIIRTEYHKSQFLDDCYLHSEQQYYSALLQEKRSLVLSAPTSFGKSLLIEEVVASKNYKNIVIIQPTLALLDETRKKLSRYSAYYNLIVSTHQEATDGCNLFLFTGERVVEYENIPEIDFFVIDEFYKLSSARNDDRATTLNQALYLLLKMTKKCYLLGPNINNISRELIDELGVEWHKSQYATVSVDIIKTYEGKNWRVRDDRRIKELNKLLVSLDEPTIIYCSSPQKSTQLAQSFMEHLEKRKLASDFLNDENCGEIVEWLKENIHSDWYLSKLLKHGIAFHHGNIPRHLGSSIVDKFNTGSIRYLFCTSTLIEGVNTIARNVILFDKHKGKKPIDFFDYKNIVGRSGRMTVHYVGKVFEFHQNPERMELQVDIPLFTHTLAPIELLIQLDKQDIQIDAEKHLKEFNSLDPELQKIIKDNSGVLVKGQLNIVKELNENVKYYAQLLSWSKLPTYEQLLPIIELIWSNLLKTGESRANVRSAAQLTVMTMRYLDGKSLQYLIHDNLNSDYWKKEVPDDIQRVQEVVLLCLGVYRHWFEFKLPRLLVAISGLQNYVLSKNKYEPGNYTYLASLLENSFISGSLTILMDYDVPSSAVRKFQRIFTKNEGWADVKNRLNNIELEKLGLNAYEINKVRMAIK